MLYVDCNTEVHRIYEVFLQNTFMIKSSFSQASRSKFTGNTGDRRTC